MSKFQLLLLCHAGLISHPCRFRISSHWMDVSWTDTIPHLFGIIFRKNHCISNIHIPGAEMSPRSSPCMCIINSIPMLECYMAPISCVVIELNTDICFGDVHLTFVQNEHTPADICHSRKSTGGVERFWHHACCLTLCKYKFVCCLTSKCFLWILFS